jgi:hypothetical protein
MLKNSRPLTLAEQALATDLILNDLSHRDQTEFRINPFSGKEKTPLFIIAENSQKRLHRRYENEFKKEIIH